MHRAIFISLLALAVSGQELLSAHVYEPITYDSPTAESADPGSRLLEDSSQQADATNVTGTYKGSWRRLEYDSPYGSSPLLERDSGALFYRITASRASHGVHNVEGELVIRDGELQSEDDLTLVLNGVFVEQSRRLHAILEPASGPIRSALQPGEVREHGAVYRQALRDLADTWTRSTEDREELSEFDFLGTHEEPMLKRCEFVLDFAAQPAGGASESSLDINKLLLQEDLAAAQQDGWNPPAGEGRVIMNGTLHSEACGLALELNASSTKLDVYYKKAIRYTLMITGLSFLQILLLLPQIEATSSPALMSKVSLLTVGQQAIMDAYLCLLHLTTGIMVDPLFNSFATAAFLEFVIFAIFEMRYLLMIWRVRRSSNTDPWAQQRELSILYARFYSALLSGIFISYQLQRWMHIVVFGVFSFWVPQIVLCAYENARQPLKAYYVVGMSASRMALPLYLYGCPNNLLRNPASPTICVLLSCYVLCQVILLLGQSRFGPRFFIPRQLLPPKYNYFRAAARRKSEPAADAGDIETGDAGAECVICMSPVDLLTLQARMLTPCNHVFHPACLQRWMDVKMECPTCRAALPPS